MIDRSLDSSYLDEYFIDNFITFNVLLFANGFRVLVWSSGISGIRRSFGFRESFRVLEFWVLGFQSFGVLGF